MESQSGATVGYNGAADFDSDSDFDADLNLDLEFKPGSNRRIQPCKVWREGVVPLPLSLRSRLMVWMRA